MNTYEWLSIIGILVGSLYTLFKILIDIRKDIQSISDKIVSFEQLDTRMRNHLLEHEKKCRESWRLNQK